MAADGSRHSTASVPITIRSEPSTPASEVTSPTGSPTRAASSSRARVTPMRRLRSTVEPHSAHTTGRRSLPWAATNSSSASRMGTRPSEVRASSPHALHARSLPRPLRLSTTATLPGAAARRSRRPSANSPPRTGSSSRRSSTSTTGQPSRSADRSTVHSSPASKASSVGTGDTSTVGTPTRRARSKATSRACQVGVCSLLRFSECSSSTTTAARRGIGSHTAVRVPTTVAPAAATAQSSKPRATRTPRLLRSTAMRRASAGVGATISESPRRAAARATAAPLSAGGHRSVVTARGRSNKPSYPWNEPSPATA